MRIRKHRNRIRRRKRKNTGRLLIVSILTFLAASILATTKVSGRNGEAQSGEAEVQQAEEGEGDVSASGLRISTVDDGLEELEAMLGEMTADEDGIWSIYVKDLGTDECISINNQSMYAASLIKLFVMESSFLNLDKLAGNAASYSGIGEDAAYEYVTETLADMIEISDNESYNELVRLNSREQDFTEGCLALNEYLEDSCYINTGIYHTLSPSDTEPEKTADKQNYTSVEDCGTLLEAIYDGTCVSETASEMMLGFLLQQQVVNKIPAGLPSYITAANKTGETDDTQHDAAIVFGDKTDYILCIMSSDITDAEAAAAMIQDISGEVYQYLNEEV